MPQSLSGELSEALFSIPILARFQPPRISYGKTWWSSRGIHDATAAAQLLLPSSSSLSPSEGSDIRCWTDLDVGQNGRPLMGPQMWMSSLVFTIQLLGYLILTHTHLLFPLLSWRCTHWDSGIFAIELEYFKGQRPEQFILPWLYWTWLPWLPWVCLKIGYIPNEIAI